MNEKEIKTLIKQLKQQFKKQYPKRSDEEVEKMILDVFFQAYCEDKMDREDLTTLTMAMGYAVDNDVLDQIEKEKNRK